MSLHDTCRCGNRKRRQAARCWVCVGYRGKPGGDGPEPSPLDLAEVLDGTRAGQTAASLAAHLGVSARTVVRYRGRLRESGRL